MDQQPIRGALDAVSLIGVIGTLVGWLPAIAAALSIAWYCYSFYLAFKGKKGLDG